MSAHRLDVRTAMIALLLTADDTGCTDDLIVVSKSALREVAETVLLEDFPKFAPAFLDRSVAPRRSAITNPVHREIDELVKLDVLTPERARRLKSSLTATVTEAHLSKGMSIRELIDLYNDLAGPR